MTYNLNSADDLSADERARYAEHDDHVDVCSECGAIENGSHEGGDGPICDDCYAELPCDICGGTQDPDTDLPLCRRCDQTARAMGKQMTEQQRFDREFPNG